VPECESLGIYGSKDMAGRRGVLWDIVTPRVGREMERLRYPIWCKTHN